MQSTPALPDIRFRFQSWHVIYSKLHTDQKKAGTHRKNDKTVFLSAIFNFSSSVISFILLYFLYVWLFDLGEAWRFIYLFIYLFIKIIVFIYLFIFHFFLFYYFWQENSNFVNYRFFILFIIWFYLYSYSFSFLLSFILPLFLSLFLCFFFISVIMSVRILEKKLCSLEINSNNLPKIKSGFTYFLYL